MKVESKPICDFFEQLKYFVDQINETIRSGDDGFQECVYDQTSEIKKALDSFAILNLTPVTVKEKTELEYLKFYNKNASVYEIKSFAADENVKIYKAELYLFIKRALREMKGNDLAQVPNNELYNWIETYTIFNGSIYEKLVGSNEWYRPSLNVVNDIVNEIIDQRKKAPQQLLFS